jgi:hypothetical protein
MQNSKKSEKSRGIVAFANNTSTTNYVDIAHKTLGVASQVLNLPYTILSNNRTTVDNYRYDIDISEFVEWNNSSRYMAYELSPYDETLVIDADFLILDSSIKNIFDVSWDYLLQRKSMALTQEWPSDMGPYSLPLVWATVFAFRKTDRAKMFFNLIKRIENNYEYYHSLYNIRERNYRNDYAFAIADYILNGYALSDASIPGNMLTINQVIDSITIKDSQLIVKDNKNSYVLPKTNMHIMSKAYLQSDNFTTFINSL